MSCDGESVACDIGSDEQPVSTTEPMLMNNDVPSSSLAARPASSFKCAECAELIAGDSAQLETHMRRHLDYKPWSCALCAFCAFDEADVERHASDEHGGDDDEAAVVFKPVANQEATVAYMLTMCTPEAGTDDIEVVKNEDHELPPTVNTMGSRSRLKAAALQQQNPSGAERFIACTLCNGRFCVSSPQHAASSVIEHVKYHVNFAGYECPFCLLIDAGVFSSLTTFIAHLEATHVEAERTPVIRAMMPFLRDELLDFIDEHLVDVGVLDCALCSTRVPFARRALIAHVRHHLARTMYVCTHCAHEAPSAGMVFEHAKTHPEVEKVVGLRARFEDDEALGEQFDVCFPALSASAIELVRGVKGVMTAPEAEDEVEDEEEEAVVTPTKAPIRGATTAQCSVCRAHVPRTMETIVAHVKVHLGYKPLKCSSCDFRHFSMSKIRRHRAHVHGSGAESDYAAAVYQQVPGIATKVREMKQRCFGATLAHLDQDILRHVCEDELPFVSTELTANRSPIKPALPLLQQTLLYGAPTPGVDLLRSMVFGANDDAAETQQDVCSVGKKLCQLCNTLIANNPNSFENHACKHLDYKPFCCAYCPYQSYIRGKVTRHIQQVHQGFQIKVLHRPIPGMRDKIQSVKARCFPFNQAVGGGSGAADFDSLGLSTLPCDTDTSPYMSTSRSSSSLQPPLVKAPSPLDRISCLLCRAKLPPNIRALNEHAQARKTYHCPVCPFETTYLIRAKQHMLGDHPDEDAQAIVCCPPDAAAGGLEAVRVKCFGRAVVDAVLAGEKSPVEPTSPGALVVDEHSPMMKKAASSTSLLFGGTRSDAAEGEEEYDFDESSNGDGLEGKNGGECVACAVCTATVENDAVAIGVHVRNHLDYKPYQCAYCNWKSVGESEVKQHIMANHKSAPLKVIYHPERTQLSRMQAMCFPQLVCSPSPTPPILPGGGISNGNVAASAQAGGSGLKKLVCRLCNNTIADNPKSVGIHVKNHLNYKPFRCQFCKYMSCEQSKARRHVEHVHGFSGDTIQVELDDNIKEKVAEMKNACFPNLGHMGVSEMYGGAGHDLTDRPRPSSTSGPSIGAQVSNSIPSSPSSSTDSKKVDDCPQQDGDEEFSSECYECSTCHQGIPFESIDYHVRTHLGRPYKCTYCATRFWTDAAIIGHIKSVHPGQPARAVRVSGPGGSAHMYQGVDIEIQFGNVKRKCFPQLAGEFGQGEEGEQKQQRVVEEQYRGAPMAVALKRQVVGEPGKILCMMCEQSISSNNNSMDVHVKNHLNYKPHQCGYCDYRSCIVGKVRRHVDNVHRGSEARIISFNYTSNRMKEIFQELKVACFPHASGLSATYGGVSMVGGGGGAGGQEMSKAMLIALLDDLRERLSEEVQSLALSQDGQTAPDDTGGIPVEQEDNALILDEIDDDGDQQSLSEIDTSTAANDLMHLLNTSRTNADELESVGSGEAFSPTALNAARSAHNGASTAGARLVCRVCMSQVADNPSSIALHVRNHLDYKPFKCSICEYRSCIQAKVRRHLRNVHKDLTDGIVNYYPVDNIRQKVTEMKMQCFPKFATTATSEAVPDDDDDETDTTRMAAAQLLQTAAGAHHDREQQSLDLASWNSSISAYLDAVMGGAAAVNGAHAEEEHEEEPLVEGDLRTSMKRFFAATEPNCDEEQDSYLCQLCDQSLEKHDEELLTLHVRKHMQRAHFRCNLCAFVHGLNSSVKEHVRGKHAGEKSMKIVYVAADPLGDFAMWRTRCFPNLSTSHDVAAPDNNNTPSPASPSKSLTRQTQRSAPSNGVSTRQAGIKLGPAYREWYCCYCEFSSTSKYLVKQHCITTHPGKPVDVSDVSNKHRATTTQNGFEIVA